MLLRVDILGRLRLQHDGVVVDTGPRQQTFLLAVLVARAGRPISTDELIDVLWEGDVPPSALNIVQKYVGAVRRLLEPSLLARETGSYLQRRGNSYLFDAPVMTVDLTEFRDLVHRARELAGEPSLNLYAQALGLWRGPVGQGLPAGPRATFLFGALDEEFFSACTRAADLAVALGEPDRLLAPLRLAAAMKPLHEPIHAALVSLLAAAGRGAEADAAYDDIRARLADDFGLDPGPVLQAAHHVRAEPAAADRPAGGGLIGRAGELAVLRRAVQSALAGGTGLVLVEGEPGVGKTRLVDEAVGNAGGEGALVVWGHCLEGSGAPAMWPWIRAVDAVLGALPPAVRREWLDGELGRLVVSADGAQTTPSLSDFGRQFRLFEAAVNVLREVAAKQPVLLVIDDLQWADLASLQLFGHLAARLPDGVALIGTLRDRAPVPDAQLLRMLAAVSRVPGHRRIRLGPLPAADVAELVRREIGSDLGGDVTIGIHARTAGNPFFVQELVRLLAVGEAVTAVPSTVRDVVHDRVSRLDDDARDLLQAAAVIGGDVDFNLLCRVTATDGQTLLERIEPAEQLGLLRPAQGHSLVVQFSHDLARESVVTALSPHRKIQLHLRIADALAATDTRVESVAERLAHHLWAAGPLADPARTADALIRAGWQAASKSAFDAAAQHLHSAAQVARTAGQAELELAALSLLTAVVRRSGYAESTNDLLERAEHLARELGQAEVAVNFLISRFALSCQGLQLDRAGRLARQFLAQTTVSADPTMRAYGLHMWAIYQWSIGNLGEAYDYQRRSDRTLLEDIDGYTHYSLHRELHLIMAGLRAKIFALHGDLDAARTVLDTMEAAGDDPYTITLWAGFASTLAALAGDPDWALRTAERGIAEDAGFSFRFFGAFARVNRCWARAVTGHDAAAAATEAEAVLTTHLLDPPVTGLAAWSGLIAEMWLAAGRPDLAATALDRAEHALDTHGERYAEGLLLLLRARLLAAGGAPADEVRAAAERARALSDARGAHLFARRAEALISGA
ncbi:hypothetical protein GCM10023322_75820 [Rugosimonospora acidiphila]|uniref:OmpR/PhoB-type domain-containing protein n=1 Tax=Rugosimonospora acidiphila TaxID=556531 RepID=A0ABP9SQN4_9ACTN